jgi:hypothetical protein
MKKWSQYHEYEDFKESEDFPRFLKNIKVSELYHELYEDF